MNAVAPATPAPLDLHARHRPRRYQATVVLLAVLGNAYILLTLALLLALGIGGALWMFSKGFLIVQLLLALGLVVLQITKGLRVKTPEPVGIPLSRTEAPALFALLDELRAGLNAPRIHQLLVTSEMNAAIVQHPRFGQFGAYRSTVLLGLPLLKGLDCEAFRAVLAHELAHLARGHGKTSHWIYRQRLRWAQLLEGMEQGSGSFLLSPFLKRFVPYFIRYSLPLARLNEYQADASAAALTSPKALATALTAVDLQDHLLQRHYWETIQQQADVLATPDTLHPFRDMGPALAQTQSHPHYPLWLSSCLTRQSHADDTHPSLSDRLAALGEDARFSAPTPDTAAATLLGDALPRLEQQFDAQWRKQMRRQWAECFEQRQSERVTLAGYEAALARGETLDKEAALERALLTGTVGRDKDASLAQLEALLRQHEDWLTARYHLGLALLDHEEVRGETLLLEVLEQDEEATEAVAVALRDYHWRHGRTEIARQWHAQAEGWLLMKSEAEAERNSLSRTDRFAPVELDAATLANARAALQDIEGLRDAWLVRKGTRHYPGIPLYIVAYRVRQRWPFHDDSLPADVGRKLSRTLELPIATSLFYLGKDQGALLAKMRKHGAHQLR